MPDDDHVLAADIARRAGGLLLEIRSGGVRLSEADRLADELILAELRVQRPGDGVLSEESKDDLTRLDQERVWIIDPLDGTREYNEQGRTDWAVHVALTLHGMPYACAVALPAQEQTVFATSPLARLAPRVDESAKMRILVSRTRPPALAEYLAETLDGELVPLGSAGAKAMAVVQGFADVYAHSGGQYEWDSCAPVGVAAAAGCHCSRLDGSPLRYNQRDPYLPDLLICRPELAAPVLAAIGSAPA